MTTTTTTATTTAPATTTTTTGKKKFGKNLNKLTQAPAPPVASESSKANAASRNGLLLLSTNNKRSSSSATRSGTSNHNGLLANKPSVAPTPLRIPSLGLQYESTTSTHDVLLGAVVGAAACRADQAPDAWGVAAAASTSTTNNNNNGTTTTNANSGSGIEAASTFSKQDARNSHVPSSSSKPESAAATERTHESAAPAAVTSPRNTNEHGVVASSNWDEYGGRGTTTPTPSNSRGLVSTDANNKNNTYHQDNYSDSQQVYMSNLARERSDRRRQEEASRSKSQKEKASQRLQALESKMVVDSSNSNGGGRNHSGTALEQQSSTMASSSRSTQQQQRTLFDPNRTYSSLVGGGGANGNGNGNGDSNKHNNNGKQQTDGASVGSRDEPPQGRRNSNGGGEFSPRPGGATPGGAYAANNGPMIHLNSYEDRDRGEAPRAQAAPRMLFDPKSGSMVAVSSRDDNNTNNKRTTNGRGAAKVRGRGRGGKLTADDGDNTYTNTNTRGGGGKNVKTKNGKKERKATKSSSSKASTKNIVNTDRKLPRTRGVLYARDDKGNCYCADGCDGDLGYGAHSVEGGRLHNPETYTKFVEQQQQLYEDQVTSADGQHEGSMSMTADGYDDYNEHSNPYLATTDEMGAGLHTGFAINEHDETQHTPIQLDWLKPNEKIELVTGMDEESPTLQATAREWAPSQAAMSAAAQAAVLPSLGSQDMDDDDDSDDGPPSTTLEPRENPSNILTNLSDDEDDDDDVPDFMGLGFDPTKDMDAVIQSPSAAKADANELEGVDFGAYALEPPLCGVSANNHNIFAFGSSAAWGAGGGSDGWGAPMLGGSSNTGTIAGSRLFGAVLGTTTEGNSHLGEDNDDDAFLSLTTGIPGFLTGGGDDDGNGGD